MLFYENSTFKNIYKYFTILEYLNTYFIFSIVVIIKKKYFTVCQSVAVIKLCSTGRGSENKANPHPTYFYT